MTRTSTGPYSVALRQVGQRRWDLVNTLGGHAVVGSVAITPDTVDEAIRLLTDLRHAFKAEAMKQEEIR
jgi:hypothetical protein